MAVCYNMTISYGASYHVAGRREHEIRGEKLISLSGWKEVDSLASLVIGLELAYG